MAGHLHAVGGLTLTLMASIAMAVPSIPPTPTPNAAALQDRINSSVPWSVIVADPGTYVFSNQTLLISDLHDVVIDGTGATLVFYYGFGVRFANCRNVSVKGFILDSDPPNYAQGLVTRIDNSSDRQSIVATFDTDFLLPDTTLPPFNNPGGKMGAKMMFWDPTTRLPIMHSQSIMNSSARLGANQFEIELLHDVDTRLVPNSTLVTVFGRRGVTWSKYNSSFMLTENVTIHAGGNMGFFESLGGSNIYRNVRIVRKPGSKGLMALNADGFHSTDTDGGPTLEDSEISFTGDDFLNIHNKMMVICDAPDIDTLTIIDPSGGALGDAGSGDVLSFYQLMPGHVTTLNPYLGSATVAFVKPATDGEQLDRCRSAATYMQEPPFNAKLIVSFNSATPVYNVRFASVIPQKAVASLYNLVNFDRRSGANAIIRQNHFHDNCGTGGRIDAKSRNATYVDNVIERFGGFDVISEPLWLEGNLGLRNVFIHNNTIVDPASEMPRIDIMPGVVNVTCTDNLYVIQGNKTYRSTGCS